MKRTMTLILVAALALPLFAQSYGHDPLSRYNHRDTDHYYGLRLGLNNASVSCDDANLDYNARSGLNFGFVYGSLLTSSAPLWLETGLNYTEKGGKVKIGGYEVKARMSYLQLPVVCKYSFDVYDDLYIQPFVGGYLALGLGGKTKMYETRTTHSTFDDFNRFDGGLRLGCGAEYMMIYAEVGFEFGLADISKNDFDAARTQNLFINVGVNF